MTDKELENGVDITAECDAETSNGNDDGDTADAADGAIGFRPAISDLVLLHDGQGQVARRAEVDEVGVCLGHADVGVEVEGL